jgi:hypothetical protein
VVKEPLTDTTMPDRAALLATLARELERPRPLLPQVVKHLCGTYSLERDALGPFLVEELPKLEDYEIDLILSPVFTPSLRDQAVFAELLGQDAVPSEEWPGLIRHLVSRPTRSPLVTEDGQSHTVPLREVTIERYVRRLRLGATIPASLFELLSRRPPAEDRPLLKAIARRAIWESDARRDILGRYLAAAIGTEHYGPDDAVDLLKLAETYEPADTADLLRRIPHWEQVLRHEINLASNPKAFFNERVEELHGGGRDQRRQDGAEPKQRELAFLARLKPLLA